MPYHEFSLSRWGEKEDIEVNTQSILCSHYRKRRRPLTTRDLPSIERESENGLGDPGIHFPKEGEKDVTNFIAEKGEIKVRTILNKRDAFFGEEFTNFLPSYTKKRSDVYPFFGKHARKSEEACPPNDVHEDRLHLVLIGVPQSNTGSTLLFHVFLENLVSYQTSCFLQRKFLRLAHGLHISSLHDDGYPSLPRPMKAESFVPFGFLTPQHVVHMKEQKLYIERRPQAIEELCKGGGIWTSGEGYKYQRCRSKEGMLLDEPVDFLFQYSHC
jgi:hypothetical protein